MKFLYPAWLWALFFLPIFYCLGFLDEKRRQNQFSKFADRKLWVYLMPEWGSHFRFRKTKFLLFSILFLILALARPQLGSHEEILHGVGLDMVFVLDVSQSMKVQDVVPSRLQKAKHLILGILNQLSGDRVGLVEFAGSSHVACPLTTDLSYVSNTLKIVGPQMIQNQGTHLGAGLETAIQVLKRGAEGPSTSSSHPIFSQVVILISDGEDHESLAKKMAAILKDRGVRLYVLGVGTEAGGPIPIEDQAGNSIGFKKDSSGQPIVSQFKSRFLEELARTAGGKYWNSTTGESEVQELLQELGTLSRGELGEKKYQVYEERFQFPLMIAVILLFLEISLPARKIGLFLFFLLIPFSRAEALLKSSSSFDAYLENKKGIEAYQRGDIEGAEKKFGSAQARDPSRPELDFNQGAVEMQKGNLDRAVDLFKSSARVAEENSNESLLGKSLYNLGLAFTKKENLEEAARAFVGAIQSSSRTQDLQLDYESRKNLQLLLDQIKKQKQKKEKENQEKQEKEQQEKEQEKKENDRQGSESNEKSDEKNPGEKTNGKKGEQNSYYKETPKELQNKKFQSQKLTAEDTERVMSELTEKERKLQEKMQLQNAKSQDRTQDHHPDHHKDW